MKTACAFASIVLAAMCILAVDPAAARADWGPSWVGGGPPGGLPRPAKFAAAETRCALFDDQSCIGVGVRFWCDGEVVNGHQYQLLYQLRVQTKKGEFGPLLGNAANPNGTTFLVAWGTADEKWNGLEGAEDITRKDLVGMTNLPKGKTSTLRIEPQLLDQTTNKYLTESKSDAIVVQVAVSENGRVESVISLASWIRQNSQYHADDVLGIFADLDCYDVEGNDIANAIGDVLNLSMKDMPPETKVRFIRLVSKDWVHPKYPRLWSAINDFANDFNKSELQTAAKELLRAEALPAKEPAAPPPNPSPAPAPAPTPAPANPLVMAPAPTPAPSPTNPLVAAQSSPPAPAVNPLVAAQSSPPAPAVNPLVAAQSSQPAPAPATPPAAAATEGLVLVTQIDTGRLLMASFDGATSAKEALAGAARRMAGYFDAKPAFVGAYGDGQDKTLAAAFKATLRGVDVRGVVIASVGAKGASAAVAFDRADDGLATLPKLLAALPRGPVAWHDASTADGSIRLQLPEGWLITDGQQGMCDIAGPDGQFMAIGIHASVNTPEMEQAFRAQQAQIGIPPMASGTIVAPLSDPAQAVRNVLPQFYKIGAGASSEFKIGEIVETTEAPMPPGMTGKAAMVHFTQDTVMNRARFHSHVIAYVVCSPMAGGPWLLYFSEVGAPEAVFNRDLPLLMQAWNGYKVSNQELQRRMDDAMRNMRETNRMMTESAANARHTADRSNADFDEVIHGYRTVEDTETGKWSEVDLGWSHKIVEKLNEHAGFDRYKEIPLRDQIFSP